MYKSLKTENKQTKYKINKKAEERIPYLHNFSTELNLTVVSEFHHLNYFEKNLTQNDHTDDNKSFHMLLQMSVEENSKVVLPNMNLFTDNVK